MNMTTEQQALTAEDCANAIDLCHVHGAAPDLDVTVATQNYLARIAELETALREIAGRGPVAGHASADAIRLRLVGSQSIARAALKVAP